MCNNIKHHILETNKKRKRIPIHLPKFLFFWKLDIHNFVIWNLMTIIKFSTFWKIEIPLFYKLFRSARLETPKPRSLCAKCPAWLFKHPVDIMQGSRVYIIGAHDCGIMRNERVERAPCNGHPRNQRKGEEEKECGKVDAKILRRG